MNQRKEKQSCRFTVQGKDSYTIYHKARGIAATFFSVDGSGVDAGQDFDLFFDDAAPHTHIDGAIQTWICEVTAVAKHRIPE